MWGDVYEKMLNRKRHIVEISILYNNRNKII